MTRVPVGGETPSIRGDTPVSTGRTLATCRYEVAAVVAGIGQMASTGPERSPARSSTGVHAPAERREVSAVGTRTRRNLIGAVVAMTAVVGVGAEPASAYPPDAEVVRENVVIFRPPDNFVSDICGFDVTVEGVGTVTTVTYPGRTVGVVWKQHRNVDAVAWSAYGEIPFRHTSLLKEELTKDGRLVFSESGRGPLLQTGRFVIDITGPEEVVLKEAQKSMEEGIATICAQLGP